MRFARHLVFDDEFDPLIAWFSIVVVFFLLVINPFISAISMRFRPVKVTRSGVQGQSSVGLVEWERMRRVRFLWLGIPYARVSVHKRPILALWYSAFSG